MESPVITVLIVDDHRMFAQSLQALLGSEPDLLVVGTATTLAAARAVVATEPVDVVLLDLRLPDGSGIDGVRALRSLSPTSRVVVLTAHAADDTLLDAVAAGAAGYLTKDLDATELVAAIHAAASGETLVPPAVLQRLLPRLSAAQPAAAELTAREREILALFVEGLTNAEIAERLGVSVHTVRNHVQNLLAKLGAHSKLEALAIALRRGLVGTPTGH